jgi:hypothetical protein
MDRPSDEINMAVVDALMGLDRAEDGSVDAEEITIRRDMFANVALDRYQTDHPGVRLSRSDQVTAIEEGLRTLAAESVAWMIKRKHLEVRESGRIRLGEVPLKAHRLGEADKAPREYVPGLAKAQDVIHQAEIKADEAAADYDLFGTDDEAVDRLRASMRAFKYRPQFKILIDADTGDVIDGRQRLRVANELGITIPKQCKVGVSGSRRDKLLLALDANLSRRMVRDPEAVVRKLARQGFRWPDITAALAVRDWPPSRWASCRRAYTDVRHREQDASKAEVARETGVDRATTGRDVDLVASQPENATVDIPTPEEEIEPEADESITEPPPQPAAPTPAPPPPLSGGRRVALIVDDESWERFKTLCNDRDISAAKRLGELVVADLEGAVQ